MPSTSIFVPESFTVGSSATIINVTAAPRHRRWGNLSFSIVSGNVGGVFALHPRSGSLSLTTRLRTEVQFGFALNVSVLDTGVNPHMSNSTLLTINVTDDVNDFAPVFGLSRYNFSVREAASVDTTAGTLTATDQDREQNGNVTFLIATGDTSAFNIDPLTGRVYVAGLLNGDLVDRYIFTVTASDQGAPPRQTNVTLEISLIHFGPPAFNRSSYTANVTESTSVGTLVLSVSAAPIHDFPNRSLFYLVSSVLSVATVGGATINTTAQTPFLINATSGRITTAAAFDRETFVTHVATVCVTDYGQPRKTSCVPLTVSTLDVNDNAPQFTQGSYATSVREEATITSSVLTVGATDADFGLNSTVRYSITAGNTGGAFAIDSVSGAITLAVSLNGSLVPSYSLTVRAADLGTPVLDNTTTVSISVVFFGSPVFAQASYTAHVSEAAAVNSSVYNGTDSSVGLLVTAAAQHDGPDQSMVYSIIGGNTNSAFAIEASSGALRVRTGLNRESIAAYGLVVQAEDRGPLGKRSVVRVDVSIDDVNDNAPVFGRAAYNASIREGNATGSAVVQVAATDADIGQNANVTYSVSTADQDQFGIEALTGQIYIARGLNGEVRDRYELNVTATDQGVPPLSTSVVVTVTVIHFAAPVFANLPYVASIVENTSVGAFVLTTTATPQHDLSNRSIVYNTSSLLAAAPLTQFVSNLTQLTVFSINSSTGRLITAQAMDREQFVSYVLTLCGEDWSQPRKSTCTNASINVLDVNDNAPQFGQADYSVSVREETSTGTSIVTVAATDTDNGLNGTVRYSITAGNTGGAFAIDSISGVVTLVTRLNGTLVPSYSLTVRAADLGTPVLDNTTTVNVSVVFFGSPIFAQPSFSGHISEDATVGAAVLAASGPTSLVVTATAQHDGPDQGMTYSIIGGNVGNAFAVDASNGSITLASPINRETKSSYTLVILARDHGPLVKESKTQLTIEVDDVNDNTPVFSSTSYHTSVREGDALNSLVVQVAATDADIGQNANVTYSVSTADQDQFGIEALTGQIYIARGLNGEVRDRYELNVTATDQGVPPLSTNVIVYVSIVHFNAPMFNSSSYSSSVSENSAMGTPVLTVSGHPQHDMANRSLVFVVSSVTATPTLPPQTVQNVTASTPFMIDASSGLVKTNAVFNREAFVRYVVTVCATDFGQPRKTTCVDAALDIADVNDNAPQFTQGSYATSVREEATTTSSVLTVGATDADFGLNSTVRYSITAGNTGGAFAIDSVSGAITLAVSLNSSLVPSYSLTVRAADLGTPVLDNTTTVSISVVFFGSPVFAQASYTAHVSEAAAVNSSVYNGTDSSVGLLVTAAAQHDGPDQSMVYSIIGGNTNSAFAIEASSGALRVRTGLNRESIAAYGLVVQAEDRGPLGKRSVVRVDVSIDDVNDNAPVFGRAAYNASIREGNATGSAVVQVAATDADIGQNANVTYSVSTADQDQFGIEALTGQIYIARGLNGEVRDRYELNVTATDQGVPPLSTNVIVTVTVIHFAAPVFEATHFNVTVNENSPMGFVVLTPRTTIYHDDADRRLKFAAGNVSFVPSVAACSLANIVPPNPAVFAFNETTFPFSFVNGSLCVAGPLDREHITSFTFTIRVEDYSVPAKHSYSLVTVTLLDLNDNAPILNAALFRLSLRDDFPVSAVLSLGITACDADFGANAELSFVSLNPQFSFADQSVPLLSLVSQLNGITHPNVTFVVSVVDSGSPSLSANASISLNVSIFPALLQSYYFVYSTLTDTNGSIVSFARDPAAGLVIVDADWTNGNWSYRAASSSLWTPPAVHLEQHGGSASCSRLSSPL
jgi:hypothetical protein